ncbi:gamma carbonic anhydrase family protein, partial [Planktotalea sp.]|uniref:gamma carbonic anhydrase family protein n=1 Tax=Planktotalea sp. TaxID=2029877 RepID=UPI003298907B
MTVFSLGDLTPNIADDTWIAPDANVIGNIVLEEACSVWFGCTLRGDNELIHIGAGTNVQENTVMHTDPGFGLTIGAGCTIGHKVMLHGCTIGENTL